MQRPLRFACSFLTLFAAACGSLGSETAAGFGGGQNAGLPSNGGYPGASAGSSYGDAGAADHAGETYAEVKENDFIETAKGAVSTFGIDVDTASYSLMRRDVVRGVLWDVRRFTGLSKLPDDQTLIVMRVRPGA